MTLTQNTFLHNADNSDVNFAKQHTVVQLLRSSKVDIVTANCANHILHNAMKYACDTFLDTENIVLKTYIFFLYEPKEGKM